MELNDFVGGQLLLRNVDASKCQIIEPNPMGNVMLLCKTLEPKYEEVPFPTEGIPKDWPMFPPIEEKPILSPALIPLFRELDASCPSTEIQFEAGYQFPTAQEIQIARSETFKKFTLYYKRTGIAVSFILSINILSYIYNVCSLKSVQNIVHLQCNVFFLLQ